MTKKIKGKCPTEIQKTESHIRFFLQSSRCKEEVDEMAIRYFCSTNLNIDVRFAAAKSKTAFNLTYDEFKTWLYEPSPNNGDLITYDNLDQYGGKGVAKVRFAQPDGIRAGVFLRCSDRKIFAEDIMLPLEGYRWPTEEEIDAFRYEFYRTGMEWSYKYNLAVEKYIPSNGAYVRFETVDGQTGMGVFKEKLENGQVIMFCVKYTDYPIQYNMREAIGDIDRLRFEDMTELEKIELKQLLEDLGKSWNPYIRRIENLNMRVRRGHKYFCVNDSIRVSQLHETESSKDNRRYASGNYFPSKEQALKARDAIEETIKLIHAAPLSRPE